MKKIIVANWKMNPSTQREAKNLLTGLKRGISRKAKTEVIICPPFVYLPLFRASLPFKLGAQDCFWQERGAFTGEISPLQLRDLKVKYVLIGHSEREKEETMAETYQMGNKKLRAVLKAGLSPILCVGESAEQRKGGDIFKPLEKEIRENLAKVTKVQISKVIIAYEPLWAVGSGFNCSADEAITVSLFIRKLIGKLTSKKAARRLKMLYGGSIDVDNCREYLKSEWIDGLLVGGVSLRVRDFLQIAGKAV